MQQALFVHGMGRSPLSGWPMLRRLRQAGLTTRSFSYLTSLEPFVAIRDRLAARIVGVAAAGDYVLVGHSLGGVLLRDALGALPPGTRPPQRLFLLGSPVRPARLAQRLGAHPLYRALTRDCGQLLGSPSRMAAIAVTGVPATAIAGTRGLPGQGDRFGGESNDGVVALSELQADWIDEEVRIDLLHTVLPASTRVADIILARIAAAVPTATGKAGAGSKASSGP